MRRVGGNMFSGSEQVSVAVLEKVLHLIILLFLL